VVKLQSFGVGMALAGLMLGALLLVVNIVGTDDPPDSMAVSTATSNPLSGSAQPPASSPLSGTPVASTTPAASATPVSAGPASATTTPEALAALPDRADCGAISGSDYRSDAERAWYIANCPNQPATASTSANGGATISQASVPTPIPTPARDPFVVSFETLVSSIVSVTDYLAGQVGAPDFIDTSWRRETIASAKEVEVMSGVVAVLSPPPCLVTAHANLRAATFELGVASGLLVSAIEQNNLSLLRLAEQRLTASRANLPLVQARVASAGCSAQ
jgi:hypothetical protein